MADCTYVQKYPSIPGSTRPNQKLSYCTISSFGRHGRYSDRTERNGSVNRTVPKILTCGTQSFVRIDHKCRVMGHPFLICCEIYVCPCENRQTKTRTSRILHKNDHLLPQMTEFSLTTEFSVSFEIYIAKKKKQSTGSRQGQLPSLRTRVK